MILYNLLNFNMWLTGSGGGPILPGGCVNQTNNILDSNVYFLPFLEWHLAWHKFYWMIEQ